MANRQRLTVKMAEKMRLDGLSQDELNDLFAQAEALYRELLAIEPGDEDCDEYIAWEEDLETLDDFMDDIQDRL